MKIKFVKDILTLDEPGIAQWDGDYLMFNCPCCGRFCRIPVKPPAANCWHWDGNEKEPTLHPSILNKPCGWHGFLRKGEWVNAE